MTAIEVQGNRMMFESSEPVRSGESVHVKAHDGEKAVGLDVAVVHAREVEPGRYLVVAETDGPAPVESTGQVFGGRREERIREKFRILSPGLPGYQALAEDCSMGGLQLVATGPLEPGELLPLELGLRPAGDDVSCQAEVRWCRADGDNEFRIGFRFVEARPVLHAALKALLTDRLGRDPAGHAPEEDHSQAAACEMPPAGSLGDEQASMRGVVFRMKQIGRSVHLWVLLEDGSQREIVFPDVLEFHAFRRSAGTQIGFLACRRGPDRSEVRFLSPWMTKVLEFATPLPPAA